MVAPALIGAGIGALGSSLFGRSKPKYDPYGNLSPEQQNVFKTLGPQIQNQLTSGPTSYGGELNAPITTNELNSIRDYNNFASGAYGTLNQLSNYNDPNFNQQFQTEIADPSLQYFKSNIQPGIEEALPTFSTARGNVVARGLGDLSNNLLQQRFAARESAKNRALQAIAEGQNLGRTTLGINAVPREIQQAGLDRSYNEFVRQNDQGARNIDQAMRFLGITAGTQQDANTSTLERLIAGGQAGAQIGYMASDPIGSLLTRLRGTPNSSYNNSDPLVYNDNSNPWQLSGAIR